MRHPPTDAEGKGVSVSDTPSAGTLSKHVDEEDKNTVVICDGTPGNPNQTIINESGL